MNDKKKITRRVIINFTALQGAHYASIVPYIIYAAVFLQYRGLTNSQIGFTISAAAIGAIIIQTFVSDFSDKHTGIPIKRIIACIYIIILGLSTALALVPYPISFVMIAFLIGQACMYSLTSLLNATFMQLRNAGLNISFGLPRGVGSLSCAVITYILGVIVEANTPDILFPIQIVLSLLALICILILPRPEHIAGRHPDHTDIKGKPKSLLAMLKGNPTFVMLMLSVVFMAIGQSFFGFLINIIRDVGGNTADLGLGIFINSGIELLPMLLSFWLLKKFGSKKLLVVSIIAFFIKTFLISIASSVTWIYIGLMTSIFANGIFFIASIYFINEIVKPNERTRGQALIGLCSFGGLGKVIGIAVDGVLVDHFGLYAMMLFCNACALLGIVLIFITSYLHKKHFGKQELIIKQEKLTGIQF